MTGLRIKGIWLPASMFDLRSGRWTIVDFLMISPGSTANSNSKARISVKRRAFILRNVSILIKERQERNPSLLYEGEPVPNASSRSSQKCHHIPPHSWNSANSIWDMFPSFWSDRKFQLAYLSVWVILTWIQMRLRPIETSNGSKRWLVSRQSGLCALFIERLATIVSSHRTSKKTHLIESSSFPSLPFTGRERGMTSSSFAIRIVDGTGGMILRVSRTIMSRYGSELSSSIVGLSVETVRSSVRSFVWIFRCCVR